MIRYYDTVDNVEVDAEQYFGSEGPILYKTAFIYVVDRCWLIAYPTGKITAFEESRFNLRFTLV